MIYMGMYNNITHFMQQKTWIKDQRSKTDCSAESYFNQAVAASPDYCSRSSFMYFLASTHILQASHVQFFRDVEEEADGEQVKEERQKEVIVPQPSRMNVFTGRFLIRPCLRLWSWHLQPVILFIL